MSYYDDELIQYLNSNKNHNYKIISDTNDINNILKYLMKKYTFKYGRVNFNGYKNERYIKSDSNSIATDATAFVEDLILKDICNKNEKVIYIGDDLTEYFYEFYLYDLLDVLPYLVNNIPQHHYILFVDATKLIFISFEDEIQFGQLEK